MSRTSERETCERCRWWQRTDGDGECRAHPPFSGHLVIGDRAIPMAKFPVTKAGDWCGEHVHVPGTTG